MNKQLNIYKPTITKSVMELSEHEIYWVYENLRFSYEYEEFSGLHDLSELQEIKDAILVKYPLLNNDKKLINYFIKDICGIAEINTDIIMHNSNFVHINSVSGTLLNTLVKYKEYTSGNKFINKELIIDWCTTYNLWYHVTTTGVKIADTDLSNIKLREFVISGQSNGLVYVNSPNNLFKPLYTLSKLQKIEIQQKEFYGEEFWNSKKRELDLLLSFKKTIKGKPTDEQRETLNNNNFMIDQLKKTLYGNDYNKS